MEKNKKVLILLIFCVIGFILFLTSSSSASGVETKTQRKDLNKSDILSTLPDPSSPKYKYEIEKMIGSMILGLASEAATRWIVTRGASNLIYRVSMYRSTKALNALAKREAGKRFGQFIRMNKKVVGETGEKITKEMAKEIFGKSVLKATKVFNPIFVAFDIINAILDISDAGGYSKLQYKAPYVQQRDEMITETKKQLKEMGIDYPIVAGPLTKLFEESQKKYEGLIQKEMEKILPKYMEPVMKAVLEDLLNGKLTTKQFQEPDVFEKYTSKYLNTEGLANESYKNLCVSNGGKIVKIPGQKPACSYTPERCRTSYSWPLKETDKEKYVEYKSNMYGGVCIQADETIRELCDRNDIPYDEETGICKIDENYCKKKGADWVFNDEIQEYDCYLSFGQDILEFFLGTTITRALKQLFDMSQYEPCNNKDTDRGFYCETNCNFDDNGGFYDLWTQKCVTCHQDVNGVYTKGTRNLMPTGSGNECDMDCKPGYAKDIFFQKCYKCPDGYFKSANPVINNNACYNTNNWFDVKPAEYYSYIKPLKNLSSPSTPWLYWKKRKVDFSTKGNLIDVENKNNVPTNLIGIA